MCCATVQVVLHTAHPVLAEVLCVDFLSTAVWHCLCEAVPHHVGVPATGVFNLKPHPFRLLTGFIVQTRPTNVGISFVLACALG